MVKKKLRIKKVDGKTIPKGKSTKKKVSRKKKATKKRVAKVKVAESGRSKKKSEEQPIGRAIDKFLHHVWGIQYSLATSLPKIIEVHKKNIDHVKSKLAETMKLIENEDDSINKIGFKEIANFTPKARRIIDSDIIKITVVSYLLSIFGAFDAYMGDLISAIYLKKTDLFNRLKWSMSIPELLEYDSVDDIKTIILEKEIDSFRRDSYIEQFKTLESTFGVRLKGFKKWPQFVECGQRRNLWAHCDGIVSDQYLKMCKKVGYIYPDSLKVGDKLEINHTYLFSMFELMMEVDSGAKYSLRN